MQNFNKFATFLTLFLTRVDCFSVNQIFGIQTNNFYDRSQSEPQCHSASSGTGQCMFDLSCRLSYGQKVGNCGGFYQVCCVLPDQISSYHRQQRLLEYSGSGLDNNAKRDEKDRVKSGQCGLQMTAAKRVVGGTDAEFGSFPWMALVKGGQSRCGGALVGDRWVVTAGHCVREQLGIFNVGFTVILGEHTLLQNNEPLPRQKISVKKVHRHPLYQQTPQADRFDVALLELNRPVTMMPHIQPVCLPSGDHPTPEGVIGRVAGWGATHPHLLTRPKVLQSVEVVTVDNKVCEKWHWASGINVQVHKEMMCAGHQEGGRDACQGDSGGPLMTKDIDTGVWTLIGVVSAGYGCAIPGQPGIYHRISESVGWINYVMTRSS